MTFVLILQPGLLTTSAFIIETLWWERYESWSKTEKCWKCYLWCHLENFSFIKQWPWNCREKIQVISINSLKYSMVYVGYPMNILESVFLLPLLLVVVALVLLQLFRFYSLIPETLYTRAYDLSYIKFCRW